METCCFGEISGLEWHLVLSVLYFDEFICKIKQVVGFVSCVCLSVCLFSGNYCNSKETQEPIAFQGSPSCPKES